MKWHITLLTYFMLVVLVPIGVIMTLCFFGTNLVKEEAIKANKIIIEQFSQEVDSQISDFNKLSNYIQGDLEFQSLVDVMGTLTPLHRYNISQFSRKFLSFSLENNLIENYLVYIMDQDLMFNSDVYSFSTTMTNWEFEQFFTRIPNFKEVLEESYERKIIPIYKENTDEINSVIYIDSMNGYLGKIKDVNFVIKLNFTAIDQMIELVGKGYEKEAFFAILDAETDRILYSNNKEIQIELEEKYGYEIEDETFLSVYGHDDFYCYRKNSNVCNLDYIFMPDSKKITEGTNFINFITVCCIGLIIFITFIVIRMIQVREYESIATTISMLNENGKIADSYSAFQFIKNTVSKLLVDKKALEQSLESSEKYLKNYFLMRLLTQHTEDRLSYAKLIEYHNFEFYYDKYRVLIFYKQQLDDDIVTYDQYDAITEEVQQEVEMYFHESMNIETIYLNGMLVMVMNYDIALMRNERIIEKIDLYRRNFAKNDIMIALSSRKESYFELNKAYEEALEALDQCFIDGNIMKEYRVNKNHYKVDDSDYYKYEEDLKNALDEDNYGNVETYLNLMFSIITKTFADDTRIMKYKMHGILNIFMSRLSEENKNEMELEKIYKMVSGKHSVDEIQAFIREIIKDLANASKREYRNSLSEKVEQFIKDYYQNVDLSVGMIADEFQVDLSTLSRRFKKEKNVNVLEYIHRVRIQKAKELLNEDNITIKQVAEQCGYLNADVFIRVFKRYEGMTPGKYKLSKK